MPQRQRFEERRRRAPVRLLHRRQDRLQHVPPQRRCQDTVGTRLRVGAIVTVI